MVPRGVDARPRVSTVLCVDYVRYHRDAGTQMGKEETVWLDGSHGGPVLQIRLPTTAAGF